MAQSYSEEELAQLYGMAPKPEKPDAVTRALEAGRASGYFRKDAPMIDKVKAFGQLMKEYGVTVKDALSHDVGVIGESMRGGSSPEQTTAAMLRSYVGPTAGSSLAMKQSPNQMRMFIGERAKTWNDDAARQAQKLLDEGVDPDTVWKQTGTFKGADGMLRQEIDDSLASAVQSPKWSDYPGLSQADMGDVMKHDELYRAYPESKGYIFTKADDLGDASGVWQGDRGMRLDRSRNFRASDATRARIAALELTPEYKAIDDAAAKLSFDDPRYSEAVRKFDASDVGKEYNALGRETSTLSDNGMSTTLHEAQHAIQQREGWARGGSPDSFSSDIAALNELQKMSYADMDLFQREMFKELKGKYSMAKTADEAYRSLAGEVEARNVQTRMNMSAQERRLTPPWKTQDVPTEQQIVRMEGGDAAMSLPMDEASRMARAREMGFDVDNPVYHGTAKDFDAFDPDRAIGTQFWSTTDKAAIEAGDVGAAGSGVIKKMYHKVQNPAGWDEYDKFGIDELIARGYDGVILPDADGAKTVLAFKPSQYRDIRAAFDPAKADSSNLMAAGADPITAGLMLNGQMEDKDGK